MKSLIAFILLLLPTIALAGDIKAPEIGQAAPAFTLKNYDGATYELGKLLKENKLVVVMFIATQCPVSNAYNDRMEKLYQSYHEKGVAFVGINSNKAEDVKEVADHAKEHGFTFPVLKDPQNRVADLYGAQVTPETYVMNGDGKLLYHGRIDDNRNSSKVQSHNLADALDALLAGKTIAETTTRAFGCSIKRVTSD